MARFFDKADATATTIPYNQPRAMVGSAERLSLSRNQAERVDKRAAMEWQTAAWRFYDTIGELHFAFSLIGQVVSRIRLYPAVVTDPERAPIDLDSWVESMDDKGGMENSRVVVDKADALVRDLVENTPGRESGLLRSMAMNLSIPGEVYLCHDTARKEWLILSSDELTTTGNKFRVVRSRTGSGGGMSGGTTSKKDRELDGRAFVARIWRSHPRWGDEPDSSFLGILDQAEQLSLLDQVMRAQSRRAMNAGLVFIPDGISAFDATSEDETLAEAIAKSAIAASDKESAIETVTPKVIQGPPELGDHIKRISLGDPINKDISEAADRLLERIMQGIDIPKDIVKGLADVKYSNAIVIDDNLFRAHIEPLVLLIVDALTNVYLRPQLKKGLTPAQSKIADRIVMWADTSSIVTRPDHSQAADDGYDKKIVSAEAWRRTRGFDETDAPDEAELLRRMVIDRAPIPQDMAVSLIERLDPDYFAQQRTANQEESGFPDDISSLLAPGGDEQASEGTEQSTAEQAAEGGEIAPGGNPAPVPTR
jgi:hypothetical protein